MYGTLGSGHNRDRGPLARCGRDVRRTADWEPARLQDPFALRTVPQVHAPFLDALATTRHAVVVEVDDSTENPLVVADGGPLHHGGRW